jgi:hypothetical protein
LQTPERRPLFDEYRMMAEHLEPKRTRSADVRPHRRQGL